MSDTHRKSIADAQRRINAGQDLLRDHTLVIERADGGFVYYCNNETYLKRLPDGSVRLRTFHPEHPEQANSSWTWTDRTISPQVWAPISKVMDEVCAQGDPGDRWRPTDIWGRRWCDEYAQKH